MLHLLLVFTSLFVSDSEVQGAAQPSFSARGVVGGETNSRGGAAGALGVAPSTNQPTGGAAGVVGGETNSRGGAGGGFTLPACFHGSAQVETASGTKAISSLVLGDQVLTHQQGTGLIFTQFLGWLDRDSSTSVPFIKLLTKGDDSPSLTLTSSHVVFTFSKDGSLESGYAGDLVPGDMLAHWTEAGLQPREVVAVEHLVGHGYWAPLTKEGTLLVDGFLASCYAYLPHHVGQILTSMVPFQREYFRNMFLDDEVSQHQDGLRAVAKLGMTVADRMGLKRTENGNMNENGEFKELTYSMRAMEGALIKQIEL